MDGSSIAISANLLGVRYKNKKLYVDKNAICEDQTRSVDKQILLLIQDIRIESQLYHGVQSKQC